MADEGLVPVILTKQEAAIVHDALELFVQTAEAAYIEHGHDLSWTNAHLVFEAEALQPARTALPKLQAARDGLGAEFLSQCREMHHILMQLIPSTAFRREVKDWLPFGLEERCKNWVRDERVMEWVRNLARGDARTGAGQQRGQG